jgi:methyl-accepting chemotaxis protein
MKFRRSAPAALIVMGTVLIAGLTFLSSRLFDGMIAATEQSQFDMMRSIWAFNLKGAESKALSRAELLTDLPSVRKLFIAKDRPALLAETLPMFKVQQEKHGIDQAQFHVLPAVSFLRLHSPEKFGDDLTKFRPMVLAVGQDHQVKKGVAIARSGPAIFGLVPINDDAGNYVGSFEMGIDFGSVLDGLKAAYGIELALFIEEGPLEEFAPGVPKEVFVDENRMGKYLKFHSTNWGLLKQLVSSADLTADAEGIEYSRDAQGLSYGVQLIPVRNSGGVTLGVVALARDFSATRAAAGRSQVMQIATALFAAILLAGLVLIVIRGFLLRPLGVISERFAALASGDSQARVTEQETLCEELQGLGAHHETLRSQAEQRRGVEP